MFETKHILLLSDKTFKFQTFSIFFRIVCDDIFCTSCFFFYFQAFFILKSIISENIVLNCRVIFLNIYSNVTNELNGLIVIALISINSIVFPERKKSLSADLQAEVDFEVFLTESQSGDKCTIKTL